jgi:Fe2+ or Zn2+ uptake regulation protein
MGIAGRSLLDLDAVAERLHEKGLRLTPLKRAVLLLLAERPALRAEDLGQLLGNGSDLSPLYRCLAALESADVVSHLYLSDDTRRFVLEEPFALHHDFLVCTACAAVEEVDCFLERADLEPPRGRGYVIHGHRLVLHGLCPECREVTR